MAALGMFLLWFGWFGFNAGSAMTAGSDIIATVALNTTLAAAAGVISALIAAEVLVGKPDLSMIINGSLAGLVAITAGCAVVSTSGAVIIGLVAGVLVVYFIMLLDRRHIDDPVGAVPVHLVNGIWGTLAVGLFSLENGFFYTGELSLLIVQFVGVAAIAAFAGVGSYFVWRFVSLLLGGLRVSQEEELVGLDISEHGMEAYPSSSGPRSLY
jgi:Amt family ammonium transporter